MYFEDYDLKELQELGVLSGDLSDFALGWQSEFRRPIWFVRGKNITQQQAQEVISYHEHMELCDGYFPTNLWCHPDGIVGYQDHGTRYPDMESYFRQWQPIAQQYPFLDLVFITLRLDQSILCEEWDIFEELLLEVPNEVLERFIDRTKTVTLASFRELLLVHVRKYKEHSTKRQDVHFDVDYALHEIMMEYDTRFELALHSSQPTRLKKYFSIGIRVCNGALEFITDPEKLLEISSSYEDYDSIHGIVHNRTAGIFSKYTPRFH